MKIYENKLTAKQFFDVRTEVAFKEYPIESIEKALKNSVYVVHIEIDGEVAGIGRIIGDDEIAFLVKDVVIAPKFQGKGLGTIIMKRILRYIEENACEGAYIGLMSSSGKEDFYKKLGFDIRPNETMGSGMIKFNKK